MTTTSKGDTVATVINWKETKLLYFKFYYSDIGLLPAKGTTYKIRDLTAQQDLDNITINYIEE